MTILFEYNCDGGTPTTGTKLVETTSTETVNSRTAQYSNATEENILISRNGFSIDSFDIQFDIRLEQTWAGDGVQHIIIGDLDTQGPNEIIFWKQDNALSLYTFNDSGIAIALVWTDAAVQTIFNDGNFHTLRIKANNSTPVAGANYAALYVDGSFVPSSSGDPTISWTATVTQRTQLSFLSNTDAYSTADAYIDNITIDNDPNQAVFAISEFTDGAVFPFNDAFQHNLNIAGTYVAGSPPTGVEARIFRRDTLATVPVGGNSWNRLTSEVIEFGIFSGTLDAVPKTSSWLGIEIRNVAQTENSTSTLSFGVGFVAGCIGQSNMELMFLSSTAEVPHALTRLVQDTDGAVVTMAGAGGISLANSLRTIFDCPVMLVDSSLGTTALVEENAGERGWWLTTDGDLPHSNYSLFLDTVNAIGGALNAVFWYQGEQDSWNATYLTYGVDEVSFFQQIRSDVANANSGSLSIISSLIARWLDPQDENNWPRINSGKLEHARTDTDVYVITGVDQGMMDNYHIDVSGHMAMGLRFASVAGHILGAVTEYEFPSVVNFLIVGSTTTDITLDIPTGTDFTPTTGIDGVFEVLIGGAWVETSGVRQSSSIVRLTHQTGVVDGSRCLWGKEPDITNIIKDNSALQLPVLPNYDIVNGALASYTLQVDIIPIEGEWSYNGGISWNASGASISLVEGDIEITYKPVSGYTTLPNETISLSANSVISRNYTQVSGIIFEYNCDGGTPTIGTKVFETTSTETVNSRTAQYSNAAGEHIIIDRNGFSIDSFDIQFDIRLEQTWAGDGSQHVIIGDLDAQGANELMLWKEDEALSLYAFNDSGIAIALVWTDAAVQTIFNDGNFHTLRIKANNTAPVTGSDHVALYIDDSLVSSAFGDPELPWTSTSTPRTQLAFLSNTNSYSTADAYIDNITVIRGQETTYGLTCNTTPPSAEWSVNGGDNWNASGSTVDLPVGSVTVIFNYIFGYKTPLPQTINLTSSTTISAIYEIRHEKIMADYLPTLVSDYSSEILDINPHRTVQTAGSFKQSVYEPDGGENYVVTLNDSVDYFVTLQWVNITALDKSTILDFYYNSAKGKGKARSFLWLHPTENQNYVVKFVSDVGENLGRNLRFGISSITLKVIGIP